MQMVSTQINAKGIIRENEFSRTNEFLFFLFIGDHRITPLQKRSKREKSDGPAFAVQMLSSARGTPKGGPEQFYPIYVRESDGQIVDVGKPLTPEQKASEALL